MKKLVLSEEAQIRQEKFGQFMELIGLSERSRLNYMEAIRTCSMIVNYTLEKKGYESIYDNILQNICDSTSYLCYYEDEKYFLVINSDTIQIRLHKRAGMAPPMHIREQGKEYDFYGVRECGISLKNESYNLSHPASRDLKTDIMSYDSISGKNIKRLIEQKVQYYKNRKDRFIQILEKDRHISFGDFLIICLLDQDVINSKANIFIRVLLVIQAIIITFIAGYIYQIVYKILDGGWYL